ncbi:amidohydrolase family protein [Sarocladium implicatum]|nr:amidohydrolase family protein [Sarocladium implicatum]
MTIIKIVNVNRFDSEPINKRSTITFLASPGNVMDAVTLPDEIIDGTGCTIMPGLIDSKIDADAAIHSLHKFASHGITTVVDLSSGTIHSETMRSASLEVPGLTSYLSAGSGIGSLSNESSTTFSNRAIRGISTAKEAEDLVIDDASGYSQTDFVRLIVDAPGLDGDILVSAVDASHQRGKLAIAYAAHATSYQKALRSGFDIITPVPNDAPLDSATITQVAAAGIAVIPTLCFQKHALGVEEGEGDTPTIDISQALVNVKMLHDAGVRICAGTCANERGRMSMAFGSSLHEELQLLVEAGLSNREALQCATFVPAKVFGLNDRGSLEPGTHRADLVLVDGDPSEDISAASRIKRVWIQGIEVLSEE